MVSPGCLGAVLKHRDSVGCGDWLGEDTVDDVGGFDAGEFHIESLVSVGEALVIDTEEVEHGGVEVTDVDDIVDRVVAEFVGCAVGGAGLDAAAGEPHGEAFDMVVAAFAAFFLGHGSAAEFSAPDDECVVEEAALFEVGEEGPGGFIGEWAADVHIFDEVAVVVPSAVVEVDEADAFFGEAAGEEAIGGVGAVAGLGSVHIEDVLGFVAEVHQVGDGHLHLEGHFVGGDPGFDFWVMDGEVPVGVELLDGLDELLLLLWGEAFGVVDIMDGVTGAIELDALEAAGEEAGGPLAGGDGLGVTSALAGEDHEAGEVLGFGAEAVGDPSAHGGAAADGGACIHERVGGVMVDLFRDHGADDADVVGHFGVVGEEV